MLESPVVQVLFVLGLSLIIELGAIYFVLPMLERGGAVGENYLHVRIPVAGGITFSVTILTALALITWMGLLADQDSSVFLLACVGMSFLGFIDDMLGHRDSLGFRGHFKRLLAEKQLTTGALKAMGGGVIALYAALHYSVTLTELAVNILLIALFTNSMNLFDLRPGRCVKYFLLLYIPLIFCVNDNYLIFLPVLGAVLAYFHWDVRARVMMGDTGSNLLGVTLGIMATSISLEGRILLVLLLVALHVFTERYSLTKIIAANPVLRWFDDLGRSENPGGQ